MDELLDLATRRRICLVVGAAGWGKSTTVSSWAGGTRAATVRCHDDRRRATSLLADMQEVLRHHLPLIDDWSSPVPDGYAEATGLCRRLGDHLAGDLVLVVDDVQEVRPESEAASLLHGLCREAPDSLHLVLISRVEPPFALRRLRAQGLVAELAAPALALDVSDVADLLGRVVGEATDELAVQLHDRTGGWPALVDSAARSLRSVEPALRTEALGRLTTPGQPIHDYLAKEVVGREPESVREVLRRLAICGAAGSTGANEEAAVLMDLARRGFVSRGPGDRAPWTLVRPLRDYFDDEGALAAGHRAASYRRTRLPATHPRDPLPPQRLDKAKVTAGAREYFGRAGADGHALDPGLALRMAQKAFARGKFGEVPVLHRRARNMSPGSADEARMLALDAVTHRMLGELTDFRDVLVPMVAMAKRCDRDDVWGVVHAALGLQAGVEGDHRRASEHLTSAVESAAAAGDDAQMCLFRALRAGHLLEFGQPRQALAEADAALRIGAEDDHAFAFGHAVTTRGRANLRLGDLEQAAADFERAVDLFQGLRSRFQSWPLCGLGDVHRTRGHLARARAAFEEALTLAEAGQDVIGMTSALSGLARVRAADDIEVARELADRAVALGDGALASTAHLTRGWVALQADNRQTAASDAAQAGSTARLRHDDPGLAEALVLGAMSSESPHTNTALFAEAIDIWHHSGHLLDETICRAVSAEVGAGVGGAGTGGDAEDPHRTLRGLGVDVAGRVAGPLGAMRLLAPTTSIRTLGAFQVVKDGSPVPTTAWQSKKARELLKILVAHRRPVAREQLIELLWPGTVTARSGNRLSVVLSVVRDVLQARRGDNGPLGTDGTSVWLDGRRVSIDVEEFLTRARRALSAHDSGGAHATAQLVEADTIHNGEFLEDDPYHEWAQPLAEEVRATHTSLLRALAARLREAGEIDGAIRYLLRLLAYDGYDEQAHLDLVTVHLEAGHFGEARRRYLIYTKRMKEVRVAPQPMPVMRRVSQSR